MAMAFGTWLDWSQERAAIQAMHDWVVVHWISRELRWAFNMWRHAMRHERKFSTEERAMRFWLNRHLAGAWNGWEDYMEHLRAQEAVMRRAAAMWTKQGIAKAINQWLWAVERARLEKEQLAAAAFRWMHKELAAAFDTFRLTVQSIDEDNIAIAKMHFKFSNLMISVNQLRDYSEFKKLQGSDTVNAAKAAAHLRTSSLFAGFAGFVDNIRNKPAAPEPATPPPTPPAPVHKGLSSRVAKGVDPYGLFSVLVSGASVEKKDKALYYAVKVTLEGRTDYTLKKKFRDFDIFHGTLTDRFGSLMDPRKGGPVLPPKKGNKADPDFFEKQAQKLHHFVQELTSHSQIAASEELCEFLEFNVYY